MTAVSIEAQNRPTHAALPAFEVRGADLTVGGYSMPQISALLDKKVFYAYDRQLITAQVQRFRQAMPSQLQLHYAVKANPFLPVVQHLTALVDGFDVASQQEMLMAVQTGMPVKDISFAGPGKTDNELVAAITLGVTIHVESIGELSRIDALGRQLAVLPTVALRVNPAFELKSSGMKMAGGAKPFGIDEEQVFHLLANFAGYRLKLRGFHIFCGSQNLNVAALMEAHQHTFALAARLTAASPQRPEVINIGGGLGVPYFAGEQRLDIALIGSALRQLMDQYHAQLRDINLVMELGRYLVAEAGIYVCQVLDKKVSRGTTYLVCNGGLHHHLANSGNFGQVIRKNYPVAIANRIGQTKTEVVNIVGPLCTPLDVLAERMELAAAEVGDWVAIFQSGAYGPTASPQGFLGHPAVAEVLL